MKKDDNVRVSSAKQTSARKQTSSKNEAFDGLIWMTDLRERRDLISIE